MKHMLFIVASIGLLSAPSFAETLPTSSPRGHELIKAQIVDPNPSNFVINVRQMANMFADQEAPTFAVYTSSRLPQTCGDFSRTKLTYQKPTKYERVFNLADQPGVLKAIEEYQCVIIPNIPPAG